MIREWKEKAGNQLLAQEQRVVLKIGSDIYTQEQMVEILRCGKFRAAGNFTRGLLTLSPRPRSVEDVAERLNAHTFFDIPGLGPSSLWVWLCVLGDKGIDVNAWLEGVGKFQTTYNKARAGRKKIVRFGRR